MAALAGNLNLAPNTHIMLLTASLDPGPVKLTLSFGLCGLLYSRAHAHTLQHTPAHD